MTCSVKVETPYIVVGVPVISPVELLILRPLGRLPLIIVKLKGVSPPLVAIV